ATKLGCRTVALSRGKEKERLAYELGACSYVDTNETEPAAALQAMGGAQLILSTAPDAKSVSTLLGGLTRGGRLTVVAFMRGSLELPEAQLLLGGRCVDGWVGGDM